MAQSVAAVIVGFVALPLLLHSQTTTVIGASRGYLLVVPLPLLTQYGLSILQGRMQISTLKLLRTILPAGYLIGTMALMVSGRLGVFEIIILHLALNAVTLAATLLVLAGSHTNQHDGVGAFADRSLTDIQGHAQTSSAARDAS